jgi:hypothetical protein
VIYIDQRTPWFLRIFQQAQKVLFLVFYEMCYNRLLIFADKVSLMFFLVFRAVNMFDCNKSDIIRYLVIWLTLFLYPSFLQSASVLLMTLSMLLLMAFWWVRKTMVTRLAYVDGFTTHLLHFFLFIDL